MHFRKTFIHFPFIIVSLVVGLSFSTACSQAQNTDLKEISLDKPILVGAEFTQDYIPILQGKRVGIVANQSSLIGKTHLVDSLLSLQIDLKKVMSPEHGFRGDVGAGELIKNGIDQQSGLPIISLYGSHKKPTAEDLSDIDILVFDLQDVGTRFYTYLSTLHLCMEACAENNKKLVLLDRPNPNGYYVDGPILQAEQSSFVGLDPIPIVHGMTLGEYAQMLNGESWLEDSLHCDLEVIKIRNYDHAMPYDLPIKPSPNLPNAVSINLYPSLCLFEGTIISIGRGTGKPFQLYGHPKFTKFDTTFTPKSMAESAPNPKLENQLCHGYSLSGYTTAKAQAAAGINLQWIIDAYVQLGKPKNFFNSFFYNLSGNKTLRKQIESGMSEAEIKATWQEDLNKFKLIRKKYLLYPDYVQ